MDYRVILWDFDGTLVDTSPGIFRSLFYAFERMGLPEPDTLLLQKFIGPPILYSFQEYVGLPEKEALEALGHFRTDYESEGLYIAKVYDELPPLLMRLREKGIKNAVATMKPERMACTLLDHFGIGHLLDACCGNTADETKSQTKAQLILTALDKLGETDPSRAALVGDTIFDAQGARETGIDFIAAAYGFGGEELAKTDAVYAARSPACLSDFFFKE